MAALQVNWLGRRGLADFNYNRVEALEKAQLLFVPTHWVYFHESCVNWLIALFFLLDFIPTITVSHRPARAYTRLYMKSSTCYILDVLVSMNIIHSSLNSN